MAAPPGRGALPSVPGASTNLGWTCHRWEQSLELTDLVIDERLITLPYSVRSMTGLVLCCQSL